jgi:imidazolonepropionase-like amidohydrolase
MQELVRRLHARGVRIYAGTDPIQPFVVPGASLHRELRLLIDSGLSIEEALAAATWVAGDSLGVSGLGKLEVGAPADLLVLREDPTRDLDALTTIEEVIAGGRVYSIESLRRELAQARAHLDQPMVDLPLRAAARIGFAIASRSWNREHSEDQP